MPEEKRKGSLIGKVLRLVPTEIGDALSRTSLRSKGTVMVILFCSISLIVWLAQGPSSISNIFSIIAKTSAFISITLLSLNFILATRLSVFEALFNGIDRVYKVHKVVGKFSLLFILVHVMALIAKALPSTDKVLDLVVPGLKMPITYGMISLLLLFTLLVLTLLIDLPYERWHMTHRLMIFPLLLASWHALQAGSDIRDHPVLEAWVIIISLAGVVSYLYTIGLYRYLGPRHTMRIMAVKEMGNMTELAMEDLTKRFSYRPGQFVFIRFPELQEDFEMHPFSISSSPGDMYIRLSIKRTGDFTSDIVPKVSEGDLAKVMGPYGRFGERYLSQSKDMVWIAGGVGITPFLSMARWESKNPSGRRIFLIWTYRSDDDAAYLPELMDTALLNPDMTIVPWKTGDKGRLDSAIISELVGGVERVREMAIFMCGPVKMMDSLSRQFLSMGVSSRNLIFEDFDLM
ncbi:MAG: ferric reductase-like transmembrane domain-containing protein [Methanomassiliicoccales archaeon]|nr:MAG: ferric reductase-like transmembrane domain-containing protein [Methanomassiliicoccales archaeon]